MDDKIFISARHATKMNELEDMERAARYKATLEQGFLVADQYLNQRYLDHFAAGDIVSPVNNFAADDIRIYMVKKIVYDAKEQVNDKLISVYSSLHSLNSAVAIIVNANGKEASFYIATRSSDVASLAGNTLCSSLRGNFPGIDISDLIIGQEKETLFGNYFSTLSCDSINSLASVSLIPSERDESKEKFIQGMEKFVGSMSGRTYTAVFLAVPVHNDALAIRKRGFESLYSNLSPYAKSSVSFAHSENSSVSESMSTTFSESINNSVGHSNGKSSSSSSGSTWGSNDGFNLQGFSSGNSSGGSSSYTDGVSFTDTVSHSTTRGNSQGSVDGKSKSVGTTDTTSLTFENKSAIALMDKANRELKRIEFSEAYGMWDFCAYFYSDDITATAQAGNIYKSLMMGYESSVESSHINIWGNSDIAKIYTILECVKNLSHPVAHIPAHGTYTEQFVTPTNMVNGKELPIVLGVPRKSFTGFSVVEMAEFGRSVVYDREGNDARKIDFGSIYHMGVVENGIRVPIDVNLLASHCFITGSSGSGKSYATYQLLDKLLGSGIKMMVIEPAKGEYKQVFGGLRGIRIYTTDPNVYKMLRINPFQFPSNLHILTHIEKLMQIFNASWSLYAAMPAIMKDAVIKAYIKCGWDVMNSMYIEGISNHRFPVFSDVLAILPETINMSDYSSDAKGDYKGALVTRMQSMTTGMPGLIFERSEGVKDSFLFDSNTIIDLSDIGSEETIALIMGVLIMKLGEYRQSVRKASVADMLDQPLQHVTILEEAHNLLKRTSKEQSQEGANIVGKSVEMISNSIKEMRTYGEGFIIIDQSPMAVDTSAIENTSTKIIMNTPAKNACEELGSALSLNDEQVKELSRLGTGVAAVFQKGWLTPVLMKVDYPWNNKYKAIARHANISELRILRGDLLAEFARQIKEESFSAMRMRQIINQSDIDADKKKDLMDIAEYINSASLNEYGEMSMYQIGELCLNISNCRGMLDVICEDIPAANDWIGIIYGDSNEDEYNNLPKLINKCIEWKNRFIQSIKSYANISDEYVMTIILHSIFYYLSDNGRKKESKFYVLYDCLDRGWI